MNNWEYSDLHFTKKSPVTLSERITNVLSCVLCIWYVTVSERQHVEVAQATIFSLSESDDIVKISGSIFQEMDGLPGPFLVNTTVYCAYMLV